MIDSPCAFLAISSITGWRRWEKPLSLLKKAAEAGRAALGARRSESGSRRLSVLVSPLESSLLCLDLARRRLPTWPSTNAGHQLNRLRICPGS